MALSTCIRTEAILLVVVHSSVNCPVSFNIGGTFNVTPGGNISLIVNPRSAIMESPGSNSFKTPHSIVSFLSEMLPHINLTQMK